MQRKPVCGGVRGLWVRPAVLSSVGHLSDQCQAQKVWWCPEDSRVVRVGISVWGHIILSK